jgi:hypothetical protein
MAFSFELGTFLKEARWPIRPDLLKVLDGIFRRGPMAYQVDLSKVPNDIIRKGPKA